MGHSWIGRFYLTQPLQVDDHDLQSCLDNLGPQSNKVVCISFWTTTFRISRAADYRFGWTFQIGTDSEPPNAMELDIWLICLPLLTWWLSRASSTCRVSFRGSSQWHYSFGSIFVNSNLICKRHEWWQSYTSNNSWRSWRLFVLDIRDAASDHAEDWTFVAIFRDFSQIICGYRI